MVSELERPVCDAVQKIPVVRDDDVSGSAGAQEVLQPFDGVQIQVVRRLVQKQKVRAAEQQLRKLELRALPAAQAPDGGRNLLLREAEAQKRRPRPAPEHEAAVRHIPVVQGRLPLDQGVLLLRRAVSERAADFLKLAFRMKQRREDGQDLVERAALEITADMLLM